MPELVTGRGAWQRDRGAFPPWRQENVLIEESKTDPKGYNILSRPPLVQAYSWGAGPIHGAFSKPGLFGGAKFVISGSTLYKDGVSLGTIDGSGPAWFAAGIGELCCGRGASAYSYDGATLAAIAMPDGFEVRQGHNMARRFVFVRKGSGRFYWSEVDDGRTVDGLNFANAENEPDDLLEIHKQGDTFKLMGQNSIETWMFVGDDVLPWTPVSQRTITTRGLRDNGCAQEVEDGLIVFVSSDNLLCAGDNAARVSDAALEEKIEDSVGVITFLYRFEGKPYVGLRLDSETYIIDLANGNMPSLFSTVGRAQWAPKSALNIGSTPYFGDDTDGTIWVFDEHGTTDCNSTEMHRVFSAGAPYQDGPVQIDNIIVSGNSGSSDALTGETLGPTLEMRSSRDGGRTWQSAWRASRWGAIGEYKRKARFGPCGLFGSPGALFEFRMLAVSPLRVDSVRANEPLAGRGW
jgi:hypothetical protein